VVVWVAAAVSPSVLGVLWLSRSVYRSGFVWQILTWPFASLASVRGALGLFFFWSFGKILEDQIGPSRYLKMLGLVTAVMGTFALLLDLVFVDGGAISSLFQGSEASALRALQSVSYYPILVGPSLIALGVAVCVAWEFPQIRTFFEIPIRFLVAAFVAIEVLQTVGSSYWIHLAHVALVIAASLMMLKSFGMGTELPAWVPRIPLPVSWTGVRNYSSPGRGSSSLSGGASGKLKSKMKRGSSGSVVTGPWGEQGTGTASPSASGSSSTPRTSAMTRADREEVDGLLDKIAREGMGSLSNDEKARLEEASRRLRDTDNR
jgi:membrane associated rhomboid family serine protease